MSKASVTNWAVGVTTAPRRKMTLTTTLKSLSAAGWEQPRLFVEPGVELDCEFTDWPVTHRDVKLGAFPNWFLALSELFMREPQADAYFLCQDDVLFSEGLRDYLERTLWPAENIGVVSVFCPSHQTRADTSGYLALEHAEEGSGALGYVFSNLSVRALICDREVVDHRHDGPARGLRDIDTVVGCWCERSGLPYFVHVPSLAQHVGDTSTLFLREACRGGRRASDFVERVGPYL